VRIYQLGPKFCENSRSRTFILFWKALRDSLDKLVFIQSFGALSAIHRNFVASGYI